MNLRPEETCLGYIPEKDNPYPLCNNLLCYYKNTCCISAHMKEEGENTSMKRFERLYQYLKQTSFFVDPASRRHHLAVTGGLHLHSYNMYANLTKLTEKLNLKWQYPDSPLIIAFAHDMVKISSLNPPRKYGSWLSRIIFKQPKKEHGQESLDRAKIALDPYELTLEECACIRWHMGSFDKEENWNKYTEAIHLWPNVFWVHVADMMATHMDEVGK